MRKSRNRGWGLLALLVASGQAWPGAIESSYRAAREIIDASVVAMQAERWITEPVPLLIVASGTLFMGAENQGFAPGEPTPTMFHESWAFDPESGILGREYRHARHDGTKEWSKEIFQPDGARWFVDMASGNSFFQAPVLAGDARNATLRRFPSQLLKEALARPESLRAIGRYGPFEGIQALTGAEASLSLFFGRESKMLGWVEYLVDLPSFTDSTVSWRYSAYRPVPGAGHVPYEYTVHINEAVHLDMRVNSVSTDISTVRDFLSIPNAEKTPNNAAIVPPPWHRAELVEAGNGVWLIRHLRTGFHMMFVEFENYLLAVDAPSGYPLLQELPAGDVIGKYNENSLVDHALKMLSERVPGKPVRYAVLTHFHSDHAGGALAYKGNDTSLVVTKSEAPAVRSFLAGTHTLCPEQQNGPVKVREVGARHIINDGNQRVEILDVGPNPHSKNMLVAWLPKQKILYVSDLLTGYSDRPDDAHEHMNRFFLDWVKKKHLKPEVIYTAHGGGRVIPAPGESG
ncbi:MAG: MBL fold metallo-hydrolase [Xanthomonadales bacterium]|nr:MBL fold metallo-hydrolase [Xanthomonadales bacterium]